MKVLVVADALHPLAVREDAYLARLIVEGLVLRGFNVVLLLPGEQEEKLRLFEGKAEAYRAPLKGFPFSRFVQAAKRLLESERLRRVLFLGVHAPKLLDILRLCEDRNIETTLVYMGGYTPGGKVFNVAKHGPRLGRIVVGSKKERSDLIYLNEQLEAKISLIGYPAPRFEIPERDGALELLKVKEEGRFFGALLLTRNAEIGRLLSQLPGRDIPFLLLTWREADVRRLHARRAEAGRFEEQLGALMALLDLYVDFGLVGGYYGALARACGVPVAVYKTPAHSEVDTVGSFDEHNFLNLLYRNLEGLRVEFKPLRPRVLPYLMSLEGYADALYGVM